jgi:hypothetical protein
VWWPGLKNSPTVTHACRKMRLKWVPSAWGYSWATLCPGIINTVTWSSRLRVGRWTNNSVKRSLLRNPQKGRPWPDLGCRTIWWCVDCSVLRCNPSALQCRTPTLYCPDNSFIAASSYALAVGLLFLVHSLLHYTNLSVFPKCWNLIDNKVRGDGVTTSH